MKLGLKNRLPLAIAITGICTLVYGTVQQNFWESLNDPRIQMAEDAAGALQGGVSPADVVVHVTPINIGISLAPRIVVYDEAKTPLESTGELNGAPHKPPTGVFLMQRRGIR
ncbi:hypothetical protein A2765_03015 [Candidatus Kaiserbacteria bacterium RIFCSPHIGHO2_01_FULL_56_24]|uniref:Uncharacterized protein n=1 Tax=Candidatus Kaiserbacteria bacterium RIFCSPHIGHO2_01_FULL_56_24 TaxID=1798487 RepID=A0A1F6DG32_9BACT|nr:MAG: hypothetical protein A2765_03015 [Candidatus Kaiserbacteria bacterium RIFCSPHIGHO2_01_FULL_56_24]